MATELQFIKSASASSVSSLSVSDCFSANYDVYKVILNDVEATNSNSISRLRFLDSGGSVISANEYDFAALNLAAATSFAERRDVGQTYIDRLGTQHTGLIDGGTAVIYIYNPFDSSSYTFAQFQGMARANTGSVTGYGVKGIGVHKSAEQLSGLNILISAGTFDTIKITVYGVK